MVNRLCAVIMVLSVGLLAAGCVPGPAPTAAPTGRLDVTVSIAPQKYFVERVGGRHVRVSVMVGPGAEPHTYEPKPEQLKALSLARAYLRIGIEFEDAWMARFTAANPNMLVVDTTEGIERLPMTAPHEHGAGEAHHEGELDPHVWLSPALVKVQAQNIYATLAQLDPAHQADYQANLAAFHQDIDALDAEIRQTLAGVQAKKFMVFHPAWGYFARDYGLEMIPVEVGGQEPSAAELSALITEAKEEGIKVVFAQPEFSTRAAQTIAQEIGGEVLLISPLAEDWLGNLRVVAQTFARVLGR